MGTRNIVPIIDHGIYFGLDPNPNDPNNKDRQTIIENWGLNDPITMRWKIDNKTGEGYKNAIDFVNRKDIQYVCGYVQKKLNGLLAEQVYGDRQRPFLLCSKGMGLETALENQDMISENNFMRLNGHKIGVPRYFREKLGLETIPQEKLKKSVNTLEYELEHLLPLFESDMRKKGINLESPTLKAIRFEQWYNDNRFEFAKRIEMDFQERNHLTRSLHL